MRDEREREISERQAQEERERSERQAQEEREKSERQAQEERERIREEREFRLQQAREEHKRQLEMEDKKEQLAISEHKRKMEELEMDHQFQSLAAERSHKSSLDSTHLIETHKSVKGPKIPPFNESKDNIDAYIQRFERYAVVQHWNRDNWGSHLSALLTGKALDVFARLPPSSALDYEELKKALYKRFEMTEDGFRKKFRTLKLDGNETFSQFSTRLDNYIER